MLNLLYYRVGFIFESNNLKIFTFYIGIDLFIISVYTYICKEHYLKGNEIHMTTVEKQAREFLSNQTLADLLDEWELTSNMRNHPATATLRGWLMDELESRNPEAFNAWLDQDEPEDKDLKWYMKGMK